MMTRVSHPAVAESLGTRIAPSSMFWRLWWRAISVKRSQAALALCSLIVGAAIASMLLNLYGDVHRKMTEDFRAYGANVVIAPASAGAAGSAESRTMRQSALRPLDDFAAATSGTIVAPVLYGVVQISPEPANSRLPELTNTVAAGADFAALRRLNPGWHALGGDDTLPPGACAVGSSLAARLHLQVGDSISLHRIQPVAAAQGLRASGQSAGPADASRTPPLPPAPAAVYRVATIITTGASEDDQVIIPLGALQSFLGMGDQVTLVELSLPGETAKVEDAIRRLAGLLPGLEVRPIRQIVYSEGKVLGAIRWLLLSLTVLILVIIALCVMATMTAIVMERQKDIGVMKALGAPDRLLMRFFLTEGAGLGLAAGALGYGVGAWLARSLGWRLFGVSLNPNIEWLPIVCGLTIALAVIATQAPVRRVRAIQPTVVLKGE